MIKATKIRLFLDIGIQLLLFVLLIFSLITGGLEWQNILYHTSVFAILLSTWQILHAVYVVKKYKDWQRREYLYNMRQVLAYGLITLFVGFLMLLVSFGFLAPFFIFTISILHWVLCAVVLGLAIKYFWISWRRLYDYLYRPKSFWDI